MFYDSEEALLLVLTTTLHFLKRIVHIHIIVISKSYSTFAVLKHGMKVVEGILEKRLRMVVDIDEMQMGFIPGKSTTDVISQLEK